MKKYLAYLMVSIFAVTGLVFAQEEARNGDRYDDQIVIGKETVNVTEKINVTIPPRVALHLQEKVWNLDLNKVSKPWSAHRGCLLVPKDFQYGLKTAKDLHNATFPFYGPIAYPAFIPDGNGGVAHSDKYGWLKGGMSCHNTKVVQKFSNYGGGWEFDATVKLPEGVGKFYIGEYVNADPGQYPNITFEADNVAHIPLLDDGATHKVKLAAGKGTTHGFLDDIIYEGFYFDGTEIGGKTYPVEVVFTLTGKM